MVNLSIPRKNRRMIDPFAGAGGILFEFARVAPGGTMTSVDIDPVLKPGLELYGSTHHVANAAEIPLPAGGFDSVITEVPFSENATGDIVRALVNINRSLSDDGVFVIMCGKNQIAEIRDAMAKMGHRPVFGQGIDRKGTEVEIGLWWRNGDLLDGIEDFVAALGEIR